MTLRYTCMRIRLDVSSNRLTQVTFVLEDITGSLPGPPLPTTLTSVKSQLPFTVPSPVSRVLLSTSSINSFSVYFSRFRSGLVGPDGFFDTGTKTGTDSIWYRLGPNIWLILFVVGTTGSVRRMVDRGGGVQIQRVDTETLLVETPHRHRWLSRLDA